MVALPQIRCQLHDHAKQYDNDEACHNKWNGGKLHGNISVSLANMNFITEVIVLISNKL